MSCRIDEYFKLWLVYQPWFSRAVAAYADGLLPLMSAEEREKDNATRRGQIGDLLQPQMLRNDEGGQIQGLEVGPNGMAILPIMGHMMKESSSFGGCSTVACRRLIRQAVRNESVTGLMMYVDSPGGSAAGTFELAAEVARAREHIPVRAHIEDIGASAAYWVASQSERITANKMGEVGSIGTVALLVDDSLEQEAMGRKVHVISTGEYKGAGAPGAPITDRQLEAFREQVNDINGHFLAGVAGGRGMSEERLEGVADGRVFIAEKAEGLGLIDGVATFEDSVADFAHELEGASQAVSRERAIRLVETDLAIDG